MTSGRRPKEAAPGLGGTLVLTGDLKTLLDKWRGLEQK